MKCVLCKPKRLTPLPDISGTFCGRWEAPVAQTHMYQRLQRSGQFRFYHCAVCTLHTYHHALCGLCNQESKNFLSHRASFSATKRIELRSNLVNELLPIDFMSSGLKPLRVMANTCAAFVLSPSKEKIISGFCISIC